MNSKFFVALFIIVVLALLGFAGYRVVQSQKTRTVTANPEISLLSYIDSDAKVRLTVEGPVTANENHNSIVITVSRGNRVLEGLRTYDATSEIYQDYSNNQTAFDDFMRALQTAGFAKPLKSADTSQTEQGVCPTGQRYIYELIDDDGKTISRLWSSSCGQGTLGGSGSTIRPLFQDQIPDYTKLTSGFRTQ